MNIHKIKEKNIFTSSLFWVIILLTISLSYFLGTYKVKYNKLKNERNELKKTISVKNRNIINLNIRLETKKINYIRMTMLEKENYTLNIRLKKKN